ncbi:hypothetical protein [Veillonella sp.]|jgi:hypothetical protein|uniref:hypothetical protein n=1 Tax=Veillonella sp. TaxID=1926307 RepID=UPI002906729F|nr:hypothetical protein [Veillonella sp.]MDU6206290.1 hypothetical protein [Veillonella sp.]
MKKGYFKILKAQATDKMNRIVTTIENKQDEIKLRLDEDEDLKFLDELSAKELMPLLKILKTEPNQGIESIYKGLTVVSNKIFNREDKLNIDDVKEQVSFIKAEIHLLGGNTLVNLGRGNQGVTYKEIVKDVCERIGIKQNDLEGKDDINALEYLFFKEFRQHFDKLKAKYDTKNQSITNEEIEKEIVKGYANGLLSTLLPNNLTGPAWRKTIPIVLTVTKLRGNVKVQS